MANPRNSLGTWRIRRRIINITLILCAGEIIYLTGWGVDSRLNETIAQGVLLLAGSVIGAYVFGASWEDIKMKQADTYSQYGPYPPTTYDDRPR